MADTNTYTSKQKTEKWTSRDKFKALDLTDVPIGTEYNLTGNIELEDLDSSIQNSLNTVNNKSGGTIKGDVTVTGNFNVNGTTTTIDSTTLRVKDKLIEVAKDNSVALTTPAGLITPKYDGTNNGGLVYDSTGTAFVGDIVLDSSGNVDVANSDLQPIATRNDYSAYTTDHIITASVVSAGKSVKFVDSGKTLNDYYVLTGGIGGYGAYSDLNEITTPGVYNIDSGPKTNAPSTSNSPARLIVEQFYQDSTPMLMQTYYVYEDETDTDNSCFYHRFKYSSSEWSAWHQVATTNYINSKVAVVEFVQPVDKDNIGNILALTDEQYNKLLNTETAFIVYGNDIYRKNISGDEYNGMMFESISGQFDYSADFYLTTASMSDDDYASQKISVGSVTGLSLGLPVSFYTPSNVAIEKLSNRRITSIDSTNKKITVDGGFIGSSLRLAEGSLLKVPTTSPHKKLTNTIINGSDETNIVNVDETRSLTVGMAISFHVPDGGLMAGGVGRIITAIDSTNKTITVSGVALDSDMVSSGSYITLYQSKPTSGKLKVLYQNVSDSKYLSFSEIDLEGPNDAFSVTIYEAGE